MGIPNREDFDERLLRIELWFELLFDEPYGIKYVMSTSSSPQTTVTTRRGLGASWITQTRVYHFLCIKSATARE